MILLPFVLALLDTAPLQNLPGLPVDVLPRQSLPASGCAAYLWAQLPTGERRLAAMVGTDPASLRVALDGTVGDYPRVAQTGSAGFGFAGTTTYRAGPVTATLDVTITTRTDLTGGAAVPAATLRIDRVGQDGVVLPLAGLIGCAPPAAR